MTLLEILSTFVLCVVLGAVAYEGHVWRRHRRARGLREQLLQDVLQRQRVSEAHARRLRGGDWR